MRSPGLSVLSAGHFRFSATRCHQSTSYNNPGGVPGHHSPICLGLGPDESSRRFGIIPISEQGFQQPAGDTQISTAFSLPDPHSSQPPLPPAGTVRVLSSFPLLRSVPESRALSPAGTGQCPDQPAATAESSPRALLGGSQRLTRQKWTYTGKNGDQSSEPSSQVPLLPAPKHTPSSKQHLHLICPRMQTVQGVSARAQVS